MTDRQLIPSLRPRGSFHTDQPLVGRLGSRASLDWPLSTTAPTRAARSPGAAMTLARWLRWSVLGGWC
jgi:hypothetical protein